MCDELLAPPCTSSPSGKKWGELGSLVPLLVGMINFQYPARYMPKAARVLAALKRDGWTETRQGMWWSRRSTRLLGVPPPWRDPEAQVGDGLAVAGEAKFRIPGDVGGCVERNLDPTFWHAATVRTPV
jgi:hypothetical protein